MRNTRPIFWIAAARKEFDKFPAATRDEFSLALTIAAEGGKADTAKPFKGVGSGVFEIALKHRGDAFRTLYTVELRDRIFVVDAFQKKSKSGVKTPQQDVDRIRRRLQFLREQYR